MRLIRSVTRALKILEALNREPATIVQLNARTGLPRTTILRVLRTLESEGYIFREDVRGQGVYFVAPKAKELSVGAKPWYDEYIWIKSKLRELGQEVEWPVYFSINDGFDMEVVDSTESQSPFFLKDSIVGDRLSLVRSAAGLAFLSACDAPVRDRLLTQVTDGIDGTEDYRWIRDKLDSAIESGCVTVENCDWKIKDRPISSTAIGLRNADRAFGAVSVRYYSKAYLSEDTLSRWSDRLVGFAEQCAELASSIRGQAA